MNPRAECEVFMYSVYMQYMIAPACLEEQEPLTVKINYNANY